MAARPGRGVNALIVGPAGWWTRCSRRSCHRADASRLLVRDRRPRDHRCVAGHRDPGGPRAERLRQQRLLDWLARHPTLQVISTATSPVHPLVLDGRFLAELYYG
jgi:hypothetical protein